METVKQCCERLGLATTNTDDLDEAVIRVEETDKNVRLYIQPGFYVVAERPDADDEWGEREMGTRDTSKDMVKLETLTADQQIRVREYPLYVLATYMDDEIREQLHSDLASCEAQVFLDAYCKAHREKYGEEFNIN